MRIDGLGIKPVTPISNIERERRDRKDPERQQRLLEVARERMRKGIVKSHKGKSIDFYA
jgi:hypothetical protein